MPLESTAEGVLSREVRLRAPDGCMLAADLRVPQGQDRPAPAVVITPPGPVAVVDQTVVTNYTNRLTQAGYVTLAVEPRSLGRSGGALRQHFDAHDRLRDLHAATSYLTGLPDLVDPARLGALGASAGAVFALMLAAYDPRITAFASVCGGFTNPRMLADMMGTDAYEERRRAAFDTLERYHRTGEVSYIPVVTPNGQGAFLSSVGPYPTEAYDYYGTDRGASAHFVNRVTTLSMLAILNADYLTPADFTGPRAGLVVMGSQDAYVPREGAEEVHRRLRGPKDLVVVDGARHTDFYDNPTVVDRTVSGIVDWFSRHLGASQPLMDMA